MLEVIMLGSVMIVISVVIESIIIFMAIDVLQRCKGIINDMSPLLRTSLTLSALSLWLLAGLSLAFWAWAALFLLLGEFASVAEAIYFASVSATTLGYGDALLSERWQLLSGFIAANGLILFRLNTAFLFEVFRRLNSFDER